MKMLGWGLIQIIELVESDFPGVVVYGYSNRYSISVVYDPRPLFFNEDRSVLIDSVERCVHFPSTIWESA